MQRISRQLSNGAGTGIGKGGEIDGVLNAATQSRQNCLSICTLFTLISVTFMADM